MEAQRQKNVDPQIRRMIQSYLHEREIIQGEGDIIIETGVLTPGVPQGLVLGSAL